jgi:hypothetical protein
MQVGHTEETDAHGLGDLDELATIGWGRLARSMSTACMCMCWEAWEEGNGRTLLGAVDELDAVLEELARHVEHLLNLVGHCCGEEKWAGIKRRDSKRKKRLVYGREGRGVVRFVRGGWNGMGEAEVGELRRVIWRAVEFAWSWPSQMCHIASSTWPGPAWATSCEWLVRFWLRG